MIDKSNANTYVGAKFSSGILPPEMIHRFLGKAGEEGLAAYKEYFAQLKSDDLEHWKKVQPMVQNKDATSYAVKTFLTTEAEGVIKDVDKLPYDLVLASQSIDLWSLGVMVYKFETGQDLFNIDQQKDDLKKYEDMEKLACWDDKKMNDAIQEVKDFKARDLLGKLLSKESEKRGTITEALNHPYITGEEMINPDTMMKSSNLHQSKLARGNVW